MLWNRLNVEPQIASPNVGQAIVMFRYFERILGTL